MLLFVAFMLFAIPVPLAAQTDRAADEYAEFDRFLSDFRDDTGTPALSAVIVRDGKVVWEGYYGWADDEGELATGPQTTYKIASTTKPIAAAAIVAEALAGALSLDLRMAADAGFADTCEWLSGSAILFGGGGMDAEGNRVPAMDCAKDLSLSQMLDMRANGEEFVYNPIAFARIDRAISAVGGRRS